MGFGNKRVWLAMAGLVILTSPTWTVAAPCSAVAGNLVQNCGFETGNFTDWTVAANATGVVTAGFAGEDPHSGTYFAALGDTSGSYPYGTLSQTITDVSGQTYTLSYWLESDGATPNYFDANWDGTLIAGSALTDTPDQLSTGYVNYTFTVTGTGSDTLLFHEQNVPAYWAFDDISLAPTTATGVPEPATLGLLAFGALAALGIGRRRVRK